MKKFKIEVISKRAEKIDGLVSYWGRITIGNFSERFVLSVDSWSLNDYKQQWADGLELIKSNYVSCLVVLAQNLRTNPLIEMWTLYKERKTVFIQNQLFNREIIRELNLSVDLSNFDTKMAYQLVAATPRETLTEEGEKISEWNVDISEI